MTQKIIYFTASAVASEQELADIAALNTMAEPPYLVQVSNASIPAGLGKDGSGADITEACDFVAGTIPAAYSGVAEFDIDNPPAPELPADQAVVSNGGTVPVTNSAGAAIGNATATVAANAVSRVALPATIAAISNGGTVTVQNSAGAAVAGSHASTVANGALSYIRLAATIAPVAAGNQTIVDAAGKSSTATRTVSAGAIGTTTLAGTDCIVKNGNTFPAAGGGTISVTVAAGVPTFTYTAP